MTPATDMSNEGLAQIVLSCQSDVGGYPIDTNEYLREAANRLIAINVRVEAGRCARDAMKRAMADLNEKRQKEIRVLEMYLKERDQKIAILQERVRIATEALDTIANTTKEEKTGIVAGNASNRMTCDDHFYKYLFYPEEAK